MFNKAFQLTVAPALVLSACISIPDKHHTVSQRGNDSVIQEAGSCRNVQLNTGLDSAPAQVRQLDSRDITILTWNVLKGMREGWEDDFQHLSAYRDILTVQEAHLTGDLRQLLKNGAYHWDISTAFMYHGKEVGVLTASITQPSFSCTFRMNEPLINIPKTVLITVYPLSGTDQSLLVVNIHAINFTLGTETFGKQLQGVEKIVRQHHGPVILSGDFNTWSRKRMEILKGLSLRLELRAVAFKNRHRTSFFSRTVDHIYYRGLTVTDAQVIKVSSSDHNPMLVSFTLEKAE